MNSQEQSFECESSIKHVKCKSRFIQNLRNLYEKSLSKNEENEARNPQMLPSNVQQIKAQSLKLFDSFRERNFKLKRSYQNQE